MKRIYYPAAVCAVGLATAEILFSILVFFSNLAHHHKLSALKDAGYLIVPSENLLPALLQPGPALAGGLFFTLTAGAGLTLLTFGGGLFWRRFLFKRRFGLLPVLAAGSGLLYLLNRDGINYPVTAISGLLSAAVATAAILLYPKTSPAPHPHRMGVILHAAVLILLAGIWMPRVNSDTFIQIRDHLLLANPAGRAVNQFYYRYTLYPAYMFKSQDQRLLHTCRIEAGDPQAFLLIEKHLRKKDYLVLSGPVLPVDITVMQEGPELSFLHDHRPVYRTGLDHFMKSPAGVLAAVSKEIDHFAPFRQFTFFSLVVALPLVLYGAIHVCAMMIFFGIRNLRVRFLLSSLAVLGIGILLVLPLYRFQENPASTEQIQAMLSSTEWTDRLAALREIDRKEMPASVFPGIENLMEGPHVPIRYWLARSLASGTSNETHRMALSMLSDPQPNVVCMALYSLGRQERTSAVPVILDLIGTSDHWYVQWYAYHALKRLGWIQPQSGFSRRFHQ